MTELVRLPDNAPLLRELAAEIQAGTRCCRCLAAVTRNECWMITNYLVGCYECFHAENPWIREGRT
jgi:hypothetical protein